MRKFLLLVGIILGVVAIPVEAQTPQSVIPGYWSNTGCPSAALTPCFKPYDAITPLPVTGAGGGGGGVVTQPNGSLLHVTIDSGTNTVTQTTGTNLHMVCDSGCSSSTAPADKSTFTFGTTSQTPVGAVYQTDPTSNPMATGQMGAVQQTINRAQHINIRNATGTELGIAAAPLQVSIANTGSNATAISVSQATGTNLHVVCDSGCSSSTAPSDASAFTASTTPQSPVGGFFQTTATNNALTTGQMGAMQLTANRALFTNLRNASGAELGVAAAPLQVSLANTAVNGTALAVTLPANSSFNESQINGVTPLMGNGVTGPGSQRVTIASDNTAFLVNAAQSGTWNIGTITTLPALVAGSAVIGKVGIDQTTPGTTNLVQTIDKQRTIVALNVATVTTGGTAVAALSAGNRTAGGWIQNPPTATINLCINEVGTASGTTSAGSTTCIAPGQTYSLAPAAGAVSVIASDSSHAFSGYGLQ